jgi:hypothetical protein
MTAADLLYLSIIFVGYYALLMYLFLYLPLDFYVGTQVLG